VLAPPPPSSPVTRSRVLAAGMLGLALGGTWVAYAGVAAAMAGHAFPVFAGFRGGKSVMTFGGGPSSSRRSPPRPGGAATSGGSRSRPRARRRRARAAAAAWAAARTTRTERTAGSVRFARMDPDAVEIRALGCLIEKQRTTPGAYPLSLNSLRLACNQATNRDPVVDYDESTIRAAMQRLGRRGWARLASGHTTRAVKYRHLVPEALGLGPDETALLAVLMLRGRQTPGELKQRADRLHPFADLAAIGETLRRLVDRELVASLGRRPGRKEERFAQLLGGGAEEATAAPAAAPPPALAEALEATDERVPSAPVVPPTTQLADSLGSPDERIPPTASPPPVEDHRIERLEAEIASLSADLEALRRELGA